MTEPGLAARGPAFSVADALRSPRRILVIPDSRPGGLFIGASKFWAIRQRYPDASMDLLAHSRKGYIASEIPFIDQVILYDNFLLPLGARRRDVVSSLKDRQYDLAFCFCTDEDFCPIYFCYKSGAGIRVGFRKDDSPFFNIGVVPSESQAYEPDRLSMLLELLGIPEPREGVSWSVSDEGAQRIKDRFLVGARPGDRFIGIDISTPPGESLTSRQWLTIAKEAVNHARILIFFNYEERKEANQIKEVLGARALMFQNEDLPRLVALIGACDRIISGHTDILHLAISMGRPVIGLFEAGQAEQWVPADRTGTDILELEGLKAMGSTQIETTFQGKLKPNPL